MWCVYKHTSKIDGKSYVGRCRYPHYEYRWNNGNGYKENERFFEEIQQHGWDSFSHEILYCNLSIDDANRIEQEMIQKYNSIENGYNISLGGEAFFRGQHHTDEAKRRISKGMKQYIKTDEHRKHLSESKGGVNHHFAKRVCQLSMDGKVIKVWDYMTQVSKELGINKANISSCCLGDRKTAGGYKWSYERV